MFKYNRKELAVIERVEGALLGPGSRSSGSDVHRALAVVVQVDLVRVAVVEETSEGELEEAVERLPVVQQLAVGLVRVGAARVAQLVGVDRVEVGRVRRVFDAGYVGRHLAAEALLEVDALEERMALQLVRVLPQAGLLAGAQLQDEVLALARQIRRVRYVQRAFPVDHLASGHFYLFLVGVYIFNKYSIH